MSINKSKNPGLISANRRTKPTLMLTIPNSHKKFRRSRAFLFGGRFYSREYLDLYWHAFRSLWFQQAGVFRIEGFLCGKLSLRRSKEFSLAITSSLKILRWPTCQRMRFCQVGVVSGAADILALKRIEQLSSIFAACGEPYILHGSIFQRSRFV